MNALGALTKGARQTGGQGLFNPKDDLESSYAKSALIAFYQHLADEKINCCNLAKFEAVTGLQLRTEQGRLKEDLPKISTFLNRVLALPIELQNALFEHFELLIDTNIESAIASGQYEQGVETLVAEKLRLINKQVIYTHPNGSQTYCVEIEKLERNLTRTSAEAKAMGGGTLLVNQRSKRACVCLPAPSTINFETGEIIQRVELIYAGTKTRIPASEFQNSAWHPTSEETWARRWNEELMKIPEFSSTRLFLICGLLLPIWNYVDSDSARVYRVHLDTQEKLLGRIVEPDKMQKLAKALGLQQVQLTEQEIYDLVVNHSNKVDITPGLQAKTTKVRGEDRIELIGNTLTFEAGNRLKAIGVFSEIIAWKTRYFIPISQEKGVETIKQIRKLP